MQEVCKSNHDAKTVSNKHINLQKLFYYFTYKHVLFISKLTKSQKISNMRFMDLIMFSDVMKVLHINRRH
jgi:hypothetical protein